MPLKLTNRKAGSQWTWPNLCPLRRLVWSLECPRQKNPLLMKEPSSSPPQSLLSSHYLDAMRNMLKPCFGPYIWAIPILNIMHYYRIQHVLLLVPSVWPWLEKGSRSSLGFSPSTESESAAVSEASGAEASVLSQSLLAAGLWDDRNPPNLESHKTVVVWYTELNLLNYLKNKIKQSRALIISICCCASTCYGTWFVLQISSPSPPRCLLHHHHRQRAESSPWNRSQTQLY